eukprot:12125376-Alexandrium_andersonii.AAC.1
MEDLSPQLRSAVAEYQAAEVRTLQATAARHFASKKKLAPPEKVSLQGKAVFTAVAGERNAWRTALRACGAREAEARATADLYVVEDVSHPGQRILWRS